MTEINKIIKNITPTNKTKTIEDIKKYIKPEYYQKIKDLINKDKFNDIIKNEVDDFIIGSLGPGYREGDIDMPCCFTKSSLKKNDIDNVVKSDFILGYQIPSGDNTIGKLNMKFNTLIEQDIDIFTKEEDIINNMRRIKDIIKSIKPTNKDKSIEEINKYINTEYYQKIKTTDTPTKGLKDIYLYGLLKMGIGKQNTESLLHCFGKIFNKTIKDFKNDLEKKINIDIFQNTNLFNIFKRSKTIKEKTISDFKTDLNKILKLLNINSKVFFRDIQGINNDKDMIEYFRSKNDNMKTCSYIYELYISQTNYKNYIKSDEYKNDIYFINIIENIYKCNVIIFEDIYDSIKIKTPLKNTFKYSNYIFIIKKDIYYEPIFYKSELKSDKKNKIFNGLLKMGLSEDDLDVLNRYDDINVDNLFILNRDENHKYDKKCIKDLSEILDKIDTIINPDINPYK